MSAVLSLYELEAWKTARMLRIRIAEIAKKFPSDERYRLNDQILRSSRSVVANIAEGFGRYYFKEAMQYFRQARGSLTETMEHISCAFDEGYINAEVEQEFQRLMSRCGQLINGLIRSQMRNVRE